MGKQVRIIVVSIKMVWLCLLILLLRRQVWIFLKKAEMLSMRLLLCSLLWRLFIPMQEISVEVDF